MTISNKSSYQLSELEQNAIDKQGNFDSASGADFRDDHLTYPYSEPLTYNNMKDRLSNYIDKNGVPEPEKPVEIAPGRFDPTPHAYPN